MEPIVRNVKLSFTVHKSRLSLMREQTERRMINSSLFLRKKNFILCKLSVLFSLFLRSGRVNATGIKNFQDIPKCLRLFHSFFKISRKYLSNIKVDNTTASGWFPQKIDLAKLKHFVNKQNNVWNCRVSYDICRFPGAFIKFETLGTIGVFKSGKYNIVGAKNFKQINQIYLHAETICNQLKEPIEIVMAEEKKKEDNNILLNLLDVQRMEIICKHSNLDEEVDSMRGGKFCKDCGCFLVNEPEKNFTSTNCQHLNVVDNHTDGESACKDCGLVLEQLFEEKKETEWLSNNNRSMFDINTFLADVCANANISNNIQQFAGHYYETIKPALAPFRFSNDAVASYALYYALQKFHSSKTPEELAVYTGCPSSVLWAVETKIGKGDAATKPTDYVNRYAVELSLHYKDVTKINDILNVLEDNCNLRPQTKVALAILLYSKMYKIKLKVNKIAATCTISTTNLYRVFNKLTQDEIAAAKNLYKDETGKTCDISLERKQRKTRKEKKVPSVGI